MIKKIIILILLATTMAWTGMLNARAAVKPKTHYTGKPMSLDFQDIPVRTVLQLLAQFSGFNIVVSDHVDGNISLHLNNIPWDQALAIILRMQGLGKRSIANVILVSPLNEMLDHEKSELAVQQEAAQLVALDSMLIPVNYAKAQQIAEQLQQDKNTLLSTRGSVNADTRTNSLWVQDIPSRLMHIRRFVKQLDIPVKQVLIEARIVNVDESAEQALGIRFGVSDPKHRISGTLQGANQLAINKGSPQNVPLRDRLNLDLPATLLSGATVGAAGGPASVGIALAKLGGGVLLDLELSALESEGRGKIISTPKIITANQQKARIETGEEIPYQESTSSGATSTSFKKAVLSLEVTPQITPDKKIIMHLKVNQDKRSAQPAVNREPAIDTRQLETQVLVANGETVVLGGIFEQESANSVEQIPILGNIPIIGAAFRSKSKLDKRKELLIFITPRIVSQKQERVIASHSIAATAVDVHS